MQRHETLRGHDLRKASQKQVTFLIVLSWEQNAPESVSPERVPGEFSFCLSSYPLEGPGLATRVEIVATGVAFGSSVGFRQNLVDDVCA